MSALDLSGVWSGVYAYPQDLPPVSFSAVLSDAGGVLSGRIEEKSGLSGRAARARAADIEGRRTGSAVTFLKMYADPEIGHDVAYEGEVSADGQEISGRWFLVGDWSGTFLMVREPGAGVARRRRARAKA